MLTREHSSSTATLEGKLVGLSWGFFVFWLVWFGLGFLLFTQCAEQPVNFKFCLFLAGDGPAHPFLHVSSILYIACLPQPGGCSVIAGPADLLPVHKQECFYSILSRTHLLAELAVCSRSLCSMHNHRAELRSVALGQRCCVFVSTAIGSFPSCCLHGDLWAACTAGL